jgi:hypothetical protein
MDRMAVATGAKMGLLGLLLGACTPPAAHKPIEMEPIGTVPNVVRTADDDPGDASVTSPNSGTPSPGQQQVCTSADFDSLDKTLDDCDVPMPRSSELASNLKEKLEVKLSAGTPTITPGGRVDVTVTLRNKSSDSLPLFFSGDPRPRFDVEAFDSRGRRVDIPSGRQPAWPKGTSPPPARDVKAFKIVLEKGGVARVRLAWDAVKMKWAPEKAKGWTGHGYPREPSGPLSKGKYSLKVVLPLVGELVESAKLPIEVGS